ncbi:MAG: DUF885 family protein [Gammaproteobacteria bacterium]
MAVKKIIRSIALAALLAALSAALPATGAIDAPSFAGGTAVAPRAATADAEVKALYDAEWAWRVKEFADPDDDMTARAGYLPHVDPGSQRRRLEYWSTKLAALNAIPDNQISVEKINAAVFRAVLEAFVAQQKFHDYEAPFTSGGSFWGSLAPRGGLDDASAYRAYIGRMRNIPRYFDEQIANMRAGLKRGFTPPRVSILGRESSITPFAVADVENNPFFIPFREMPPGISADEREALRAEARIAIAKSVAPAYAKLLPFVRDQYIPHARTTLAADDLPDGRAYYESKIREFTTLDLAPEQIHAIGVTEVARIDIDMHETMKKSGWKGDFPAFLTFLKTDPQFYAKTPYELIARSTYIANKINGQLKYTLGLLPRYRFTIRPTPAAVAPFGTGGNGGLESCVMNTYNLPARPFYTLPALVLHECSPGHSLQAALALEGPNRPDLRKNTYFSGYGEGWGLYSEWLGIGMGIYETPYDEFGRETYEMWRAARLVVDTGIHRMGWTRQQAIDFLSNHTALSNHEVTTEVDRYISWPGQALAYKLGEMTIRRKRAEAEKTLGGNFDQRWFNDAILGLGAVPLPVLEQQLDAWIAAGGKNPNAEFSPATTDTAATAVPAIAPSPAPAAHAASVEEKAALAGFQAMLDGLGKRDKAAMRAQLLPGGSATLMRKGKPMQMTFDALTERLSQPGTETHEERIHDALVHVDGDVAIVWAPFEFLVDGKIDHCGRDIANMVRVNGRWLVASVEDNGHTDCGHPKP